jgi:hypothetical protein
MIRGQDDRRFFARAGKNFSAAGRVFSPQKNSAAFGGGRKG